MSLLVSVSHADFIQNQLRPDIKSSNLILFIVNNHENFISKVSSVSIKMRSRILFDPKKTVPCGWRLAPLIITKISSHRTETCIRSAKIQKHTCLSIFNKLLWLVFRLIDRGLLFLRYPGMMTLSSTSLFSFSCCVPLLCSNLLIHCIFNKYVYLIFCVFLFVVVFHFLKQQNIACLANVPPVFMCLDTIEYIVV